MNRDKITSEATQLPSAQVANRGRYRTLRRFWHWLPPIRAIDSEKRESAEREERHARLLAETEERRNLVQVNECGHIGITLVYVCSECRKPFSGHVYEVHRDQLDAFRAQLDAR